MGLGGAYVKASEGASTTSVYVQLFLNSFLEMLKLSFSSIVKVHGVRRKFEKNKFDFYSSVWLINSMFS